MGQSKKKIALNRLDSKSRLHELPIPIIGLTGGISTGKSTVAKILREKGLAVINADELVKRIYKQEETIKYIQKNYPDVFKDGEIFFPRLREKVFKDHFVKKDIEDLIYSKLPSAFMMAVKEFKDPKFIIYDVPLLFEKNLQGLCDLTIVVYAPSHIQKTRLLKRDGSSEDVAQAIIDQQMDIEQKKLMADFIIDNSQTESELYLGVKNFLDLINV
ncbi:MAG: dephospho-CoA kinase [Bacteriovoracaceae bacterium]